jgi:hypothetical protein
MRAEATVLPPPDGRIRLSPVPFEPDAVRLVVDAEHGFLIAYEAFMDGQPMHTGQLVELRVDEQLPPRAFVFESPTGERPRHWDELPRPQRVTIEEAASLADFTVAGLGWVPDNSVVDVSWHPPGDRRPSPPWVSIVVSPRRYRDGSPEASWRLIITEQAEAPDYGDIAWEEEKVDGVQIKITKPIPDTDQLLVTRDVEGTHVQVDSSYSWATTLGVVVGLSPVGA